MKVISEKPDRLTLGDRPVALGLGITLGAVVALGFAFSYAAEGDWPGAGFAALGFAFCLAAFAAFVRRTIVFMDRSTSQVVVRVASVFGRTERQVALSDVVAAEVDTHVATNSDDRDTHRPVLRLRSGEKLILRETLTSGGSSARVVEAVNRWLGR